MLVTIRYTMSETLLVIKVLLTEKFFFALITKLWALKAAVNFLRFIINKKSNKLFRS